MFVLAALDILGARYRQSIPHDEPELLNELLEAAINCKSEFKWCITRAFILTLCFKVFTDEQIATLTIIRKAYTSALSAQRDHPTMHVQPPLMPVMWDLSSAGSPYGALAREFGVPENVVHALAQRLNGFR